MKLIKSFNVFPQRKLKSSDKLGEKQRKEKDSLRNKNSIEIIFRYFFFEYCLENQRREANEGCGLKETTKSRQLCKRARNIAGCFTL